MSAMASSRRVMFESQSDNDGGLISNQPLLMFTYVNIRRGFFRFFTKCKEAIDF